MVAPTSATCCLHPVIGARDLNFNMRHYESYFELRIEKLQHEGLENTLRIVELARSWELINKPENVEN